MGKFSEYPAATAADYANATTFLIQNADGTTKLATLEGLGSNFFCNLKCASITIPSADVLQLNSTPQTIVPAQGAGTMIEFVSGFGHIDFNTTPYATNVKLEIKNTTATIAQSEHSNFLNATIEKYDKFIPRQTAIASNENMEVNQDLVVTVDIGNPTAGDSDITVYVLYRVITL